MNLDSCGAGWTPQSHERPYNPYANGINISGHAIVHLGDNYAQSSSIASNVSPLGALIARLDFLYRDTRKHQISQAFPKTYDWVLRRSGRKQNAWSSITEWLSSNECSPYWISGKPGSGKSTLTKYLDSRLMDLDHPWFRSEDGSPLKLTHYFWFGGDFLHRSIEGFCRSLLVQILEQRPDIFPLIERSCRNLNLQCANARNVAPLSHVLVAAIQSLATSQQLLVLIDGLDECSSENEQQISLLNMLTSIYAADNVKLIISSRPETLFQDSFARFPNLRLESLTYNDVRRYVVGQLGANDVWTMLEYETPEQARDLVVKIITYAEGVFLWAVLATRDVLKSLNNGDDLEEIYTIFARIPTRLEEYFGQILYSIEPEYRREASILLQMALYEENGFVRIIPLCLADTLFVQEQDDNFVLDSNFKFLADDHRKWQNLQIKLSAASRRVQSRCKGLLQIRETGTASLEKAFITKSHSNISTHRSLKSSVRDITELIPGLPVAFMHRSVEDFLKLPEQQRTLQKFAGDRIVNVRSRVYNSRIAQVLFLDSIGFYSFNARSLTSGILAALSTEEGPHLSVSIRQRAELIANFTRNLAQYAIPADLGGLYLDSSLASWEAESSSFLTVAIDFKITSYIRHYMTDEVVASKQGRPILDYILRPRFLLQALFNWYPDPYLVQHALACGADPNEIYEDSPLWVRCLRELKHWLQIRKSDAVDVHANNAAYFETLILLAGNEPEDHPLREFVDATTSDLRGNADPEFNTLSTSDNEATITSTNDRSREGSGTSSAMCQWFSDADIQVLTEFATGANI